MIQELLKTLGFNTKEIMVYLCVLENGKITPATVARLTKINRTTVYAVAKELIKKGIITEDLGGPSSYLIALSVEDLRVLYTKEEKELHLKKKTIEQAIVELSALPKSKRYSVPKIRFIDEGSLEETLYKQSDTYDKSGLDVDPTWWGFQDHSFIEEYNDWFNWYSSRLDPKISIKLITNIKEEKVSFQGKDASRRQVKYWPHGNNIHVTHAVLGDYVIMCVTNQHPHYLVEIRDPVMAENLRQIFKGIWKSLD